MSLAHHTSTTLLFSAIVVVGLRHGPVRPAITVFHLPQSGSHHIRLDLLEVSSLPGRRCLFGWRNDLVHEDVVELPGPEPPASFRFDSRFEHPYCVAEHGESQNPMVQGPRLAFYI